MTSKKDFAAIQRKPLNELTPGELEVLNEHNRKEMEASTKKEEDERANKTASALELLTASIECETIDIKIGQNATVTVRANPDREVRKALAEIGELALKVQKGETVTAQQETKADLRLSQILSNIVKVPKLSQDDWGAYPYLDEVAGKVIAHLVMNTQKRQEDMKEELDAFRQDERGAKGSGDVRTARKKPKRIKKPNGK